MTTRFDVEQARTLAHNAVEEYAEGYEKAYKNIPEMQKSINDACNEIEGLRARQRLWDEVRLYLWQADVSKDSSLYDAIQDLRAFELAQLEARASDGKEGK